MADWYVAHLGMRIVRRVDGPPHTRFLADVAGATVVELYVNTEARIPDYGRMDPLELHLAFDSQDPDGDRVGAGPGGGDGRVRCPAAGRIAAADAARPVGPGAPALRESDTLAIISGRSVRQAARLARGRAAGRPGEGNALNHDLTSSSSGGPNPASGQSFGPFPVLHQIGMGAQGPVFRAQDTVAGQIVAIKAFKLDVSPELAPSIAEALRALVGQAPSVEGLVPLFDAGLEGDTPWLAMEHLVLPDARHAPARRRAAAARGSDGAGARRWPTPIDTAHAHGLDHGSLHPRDVFLPADGGVIVSGFGVAAAVGVAGLRPPRRRPFTAPGDAGAEAARRAGRSLRARRDGLRDRQRPAAARRRRRPRGRPGRARRHAPTSPAPRRRWRRCSPSGPNTGRRAPPRSRRRCAPRSSRRRRPPETIAADGGDAAGVGPATAPDRRAADARSAGGVRAPGHVLGAAAPRRRRAPTRRRSAAGGSPSRDRSTTRRPVRSRRCRPSSTRGGARARAGRLEPEPRPSRRDSRPARSIRRCASSRPAAMPATRCCSARSATPTMRTPAPVAGRRTGDAHAAARGAGADARPRPRRRRRRRLPGRPPQRRAGGAARAGWRDRHHVGDLRRHHAGDAAGSRCRTPPGRRPIRRRAAPQPAPAATRRRAVPAPSGRTEPPAGARRCDRRADAGRPRRRCRRPASSSIRSTPTRAGVLIDGDLARPHARSPSAASPSAPTPSASSRTATSPRRGASPSTRARPAPRCRSSWRASAAPSGPAAGRRPGRAPRPASLRVESRPSGAAVLIDGRVVGTTPLQISDLEPGAHQVRLELPGHRPWATTATVVAGQSVRVAASLEESN